MRKDTWKEIRDAFATLTAWIVAAVLSVGALWLACLTGGCARKSLPIAEHKETLSVNTSTVIDNDKIREMMRMLIKDIHSTDTIRWIIRERTVLNENGDTVRHDNESILSHDRLLEHGIMDIAAIRDSSGVNRSEATDSIKNNDTVIPTPMEHKLSWWEKAGMRLGDVTTGIVIAIISAIVIWLVRAWKK